MLKLNPDYMYFGYDLTLDENGLRLDKFDGGLVCCGDNERYYSFQLRDSEYPEDTENRIAELRSLNDFHSLNEFGIAREFNVDTNNPVNFMRYKYLARNHKLLEMVYDDKTVEEDMSVVKSYIHYVNLTTGKEYVELMGVKPHTDLYVNELISKGFIAIENSHLIPHLDSLPKVKGIRIPIKTKTNLERK